MISWEEMDEIVSKANARGYYEKTEWDAYVTYLQDQYMNRLKERLKEKKEFAAQGKIFKEEEKKGTYKYPESHIKICEAARETSIEEEKTGITYSGIEFLERVREKLQEKI